MPPTAPQGFYFFMFMFWLVVIGTIFMLLFKLSVWWGERRAMSSSAGEYDDQESNEEMAFSPATTTPATSNNGIAMPATERNALLLQAKAEALAALVKAGKIGETEGIKLVFGVAPSSSNPRYQAARAALKDELAKLEPPKFRPKTPEQQQLRDQLQLDKH